MSYHGYPLCPWTSLSHRISCVTQAVRMKHHPSQDVKHESMSRTLSTSSSRQHKKTRNNGKTRHDRHSLLISSSMSSCHFMMHFLSLPVLIIMSIWLQFSSLFCPFGKLAILATLLSLRQKYIFLRLLWPCLWPCRDSLCLLGLHISVSTCFMFLGN